MKYVAPLTEVEIHTLHEMHPMFKGLGTPP
jgi:hypothetical protein